MEPEKSPLQILLGLTHIFYCLKVFFFSFSVSFFCASVLCDAKRCHVGATANKKYYDIIFFGLAEIFLIQSNQALVLFALLELTATRTCFMRFVCWDVIC